MHLMVKCLNTNLDRHIKLIRYAFDGILLEPPFREPYESDRLCI